MSKLNLMQLVEQLQNQQLQKRDMVVPSSCLRFHNGHLIISNVSKHPEMDALLHNTGVATTEAGLTSLTLKPLDAFHKQICSRFEIPAVYYNRMNTDDNIVCLDDNVNHWLMQSKKSYLVRCFAPTEEGQIGVARTLLGDRYRILDNLDVLMTALDAIRQTGVDLKVESADITESKMYVRFIAPSVIQDSPTLLSRYRVPSNNAPNGDSGIMAGFVLTNSEVGFGSSYVAPRLVVSACKNGMIMKQDAMSKVHLGGKMEEGHIQWSEETKQKNIELIIMQIKDAVATYTSNDYLGKAIEMLETNGQKKLENPIDTITNVSTDLSFSEDKTKKLMQYFMESADYTGFGVAQAVTYFAHQDADADTQFEMEAVAVEIVNNIEKYDQPIVVKTPKKRVSNKGFSKN